MAGEAVGVAVVESGGSRRDASEAAMNAAVDNGGSAHAATKAKVMMMVGHDGGENEATRRSSRQGRRANRAVVLIVVVDVGSDEDVST